MDLFIVIMIFCGTLRLHYNVVLYTADSIIMRSLCGSQLFSQFNVFENVSRQSQYTQCKM